jgi:type I restriction enzyme R subunit
MPTAAARNAKAKANPELKSGWRRVRFDQMAENIGGEREIKKALRSTLLKYQLHREQELFDRAYEYIRQYY